MGCLPLSQITSTSVHCRRCASDATTQMHRCATFLLADCCQPSKAYYTDQNEVQDKCVVI